MFRPGLECRTQLGDRRGVRVDFRESLFGFGGASPDLGQRVRGWFWREGTRQTSDLGHRQGGVVVTLLPDVHHVAGWVDLTSSLNGLPKFSRHLPPKVGITTEMSVEVRRNVVKAERSRLLGIRSPSRQRSPIW